MNGTELRAEAAAGALRRIGNHLAIRNAEGRAADFADALFAADAFGGIHREGGMGFRKRDAGYGEFNDFRYNGVGYAILYKTDKFTPAGEVSYQVDTSYNGRNIKSFVMFPLEDAQGNTVPVVTAFLGTNHKESHREQLFSDIKNALGTDLAAAIIRICVESTTERNEFISGEAFSFEADENGYGFKNFGGVDMKKDGELPGSAATYYYYSCFLTYSQGNATITDINAVSITEDLGIYPNAQSTNLGYYTKAFTCIFGVPGVGAPDDGGDPAPETHTVTFVGMDGATISTQEVEAGQAAIAPDAPSVPGYTFQGWDKAFDNVTEDLTVNAVYQINVYTVTFVGQGGTVISTAQVEHGKAATAPEAPEVEGYTFTGWDVGFVAVTDHLTVNAIYTQNAPEIPDGGEEEYEGTPISTQAELAALATATPGTYTLIKDLTLEGWTSIVLPAGVVLGGNGHAITGLTTPLFSTVSGTVKNLNVANAVITGEGVVAQKLLDGATVLNVNVIDCALTTATTNIGGIAGEGTGTITIQNCTVSGEIVTTTTKGIAGIIGRYAPSGSADVCEIINCTNNINITVDAQNTGTAGIIGQCVDGAATNALYITNCTNNGKVNVLRSNGNGGGIVGYCSFNGSVSILHCTNTAEISDTQSYAGGIVSSLAKCADAFIFDCVNSGSVSGKTRTGGIVGYAGTSSTAAGIRIENCVNTGSVTVTSSYGAGGIVGESAQKNGTVTFVGCSNYGAIKGPYDAGGMLGRYSGTNSTITFQVVANYGSVTANKSSDDGAGGLIGVISTKGALTINVNGFLQTGTIKGAQSSGAMFGKVIMNDYQLTVNATACVLSGEITGAGRTALVVARAYTTPNPIVNVNQVVSNLELNHFYDKTNEAYLSFEIGAIVGNINDSVDTEGTVGYILNQASQQFGITWKNGESYPEIVINVAAE